MRLESGEAVMWCYTCFSLTVKVKMNGICIGAEQRILQNEADRYTDMSDVRVEL